MNSKFLNVLLIVLIFLFIWLVIRDYPQKAEVKRQLEDLKGKIAALEKDEERQKRMAEYLDSESFLEKQARLRLNLKKEGEEVVFVYRNDDSGIASSSLEETGNPVLRIATWLPRNFTLSKLKEWFKFLILRD